MSTATAAGVIPKRKRGHLRVAAILETGAEVFAEKGYDAATMSEIASRSGTATASLYRFFPSKESLADALLLQYAKHALGGLTELRGRITDMSSDQMARALIDLRLELQSQRRFALELADARGGSHAIREQFRKAILEAMGDLLRDRMPRLAKARVAAMAALLLHTLKGVASLAQQKPAARRAYRDEMQVLVSGYLASAAVQADFRTS
jgi:AcrR family transcriptional regulator